MNDHTALDSTASAAAADRGTSRAMHCVGSLPPDVSDSERAAMQWLLNQVGNGTLTTLPCDPDPNWIIDWLRSLAHRDAFEPVLTGDASTYEAVPCYRRRKGRRITMDDVALDRAIATQTTVAARLELQQLLPPFQASIPAPLDLTLFAFGVPAATMGLLSPASAGRAIASALRYLPIVRQAVVAEIGQIARNCAMQDVPVVIQIESPAILVAYDRAPRAIWPAITAFLSRQMAATIAECPPGTRFVLHGWCHGDLGHEPIARLDDLRPLVRFANALADQLHRRDVPIPPLHAALCHGSAAPNTTAARYAPLNQLREDIDLIAGLVDENHPDESQTALQLTEQALGRPVHAVAAACGLGRRSPEDAAANMALAERLSTT